MYKNLNFLICISFNRKMYTTRLQINNFSFNFDKDINNFCEAVTLRM